MPTGLPRRSVSSGITTLSGISVPVRPCRDCFEFNLVREAAPSDIIPAAALDRRWRHIQPCIHSNPLLPYQNVLGLPPNTGQLRLWLGRDIQYPALLKPSRRHAVSQRRMFQALWSKPIRRAVLLDVSCEGCQQSRVSRSTGSVLHRPDQGRRKRLGTSMIMGTHPFPERPSESDAHLMIHSLQASPARLRVPGGKDPSAVERSLPKRPWRCL